MESANDQNDQSINIQENHKKQKKAISAFGKGLDGYNDVFLKSTPLQTNKYF